MTYACAITDSPSCNSRCRCDGTALTLVRVESPGATRSSFTVVRRNNPKTVALTGTWNFDAMSVDGRTLYLTESVGQGRYWVRAVDVATGRAGEPIVTKSITPTRVEVEEGPMQGLPMDRLVAPGRTVFTLYSGPSYPFVQALDLSNGGALCYELKGIAGGSASRLRLRFGPAIGSVEVRDGSATVARISTPASPHGPAVTIGGEPNASR